MKVTPGPQFPILAGDYRVPGTRAASAEAAGVGAPIIDASYTVVDGADGRVDPFPVPAGAAGDLVPESEAEPARSAHSYPAQLYARAQGAAKPLKGAYVDVVA